jgi:pimeloyl-ACP methyl ester carboxylesterase
MYGLSERTVNASGYKCKALVFESSGTPIVFLHGMSYTREIWQTIGVLDLLKDKHVPFLALDLPYGTKTECTPKTRDVQTNLDIVHAAFEEFFSERTPLIVGSSIGGHMALNYAVQFPVKGLLLTSPYSSLDESLLSSYTKFQFPVHIIWGSEDTIVPGEDLRTLTDKLPHSKLITYEGGGHSAYITAPQRFQHDLLELYASTELT